MRKKIEKIGKGKKRKELKEKKREETSSHGYKRTGLKDFVFQPSAETTEVY